MSGRSRMDQLVFYTGDISCIIRTLTSSEISFPLWIFRQTEEVAAATALVVTRSCCVSFEQQ